MRRADWEALAEAGQATFLFRPVEPSEAALRYIEHGEQLGVPAAYKCRMRTPWWRVPLSPLADLFVTYMNADTPRLCANGARVHHLNSVHGLVFAPALRRLGVAELPLASLNSATLLGAEAVGRAYGGGMLKLEPREADRLPVPTPSTLEGAATALHRVRRRVAALLAERRVLDAVAVVDEVLLRRYLELSEPQTQALRSAHQELRARRVERGAGAR